MVMTVMMVLRGNTYYGDIEGKLQRYETAQKNYDSTPCDIGVALLYISHNFYTRKRQQRAQSSDVGPVGGYSWRRRRLSMVQTANLPRMARGRDG